MNSIHQNFKGVLTRRKVHPFYYTRQFDGLPELRPETNHQPNSYAKISTIHAHIETLRRAMALYGECADTIRVYEKGRLLETHVLPGKRAP